MSVVKAKDSNFKYRTVSRKVIDNIIKDIGEGSPKKYAARANGITETHLHNLIKQGLFDIDHNILDSLEAHLVVSLGKIHQEEIKYCKGEIKFSADGHKGAEWILKHAYWREFGNNAAAQELAEEISRLKVDFGDLKNVEINNGETEEDTQE